MYSLALYVAQLHELANTTNPYNHLEMMTMSQALIDELVDMVYTIDERGEGLSEWEVDFISGLVNNPKLGMFNFSPKQELVIRRLFYEKVQL